MKFYFGERSEYNLEQGSFFIVMVMREALGLGIMDMAVIESFRDKVRQDRKFDLGRSQVKWPDSKHNSKPPTALDVVPWINGKLSWNKLHCCVLAGIILACAANLGRTLRWGGNWDLDSEPVTDQDFQDLVHYEEVD